MVTSNHLGGGDIFDQGSQTGFNSIQHVVV